MRLLRISVIAAAVVSLALAVLGCGSEAPETAAVPATATAPRDTPSGGMVPSISSGDFHTCGLRTDGTVVCWGGDEQSSEHKHRLTTPPAGETFSAISSGGTHTCGLRADGSPVCWGYDPFGQATPPAGEMFTVMSSGGWHTCGLRADGSVVSRQVV